MILQWQEKDIQTGCIVGNENKTELFILAWRHVSGSYNAYGVVSLLDGMFLEAGENKTDFAEYLTKHDYIPKHPTPRAQALLDKAVTRGV